jgi:hypothetical protein
MSVTRPSLVRTLLTVAAPLALLSLGACATPFRADVARFQALPPAQGQSFAIAPADPANQGSLEFQSYAQLVGQRLQAKGYVPSADPKSASLMVILDYGVDNGREVVRSTPTFGGGYGGFGGFGGYGRFGGGYGRFGYPFSYGWGDPFFGGYPDVRSYTVYTSFLDMRINRAVDGQSLFEGSAKAKSGSDKLTYLVPNLVEAMFTGFPGNSGEEIRITIPPAPRKPA